MDLSPFFRDNVRDPNELLDYDYGSAPYTAPLPEDFICKRDNLITQRPYSLRFSEKQGFVFFYVTGRDNDEISFEVKENIIKNNNERQTLPQHNETILELGSVSVTMFEDVVVIHYLKYNGSLTLVRDGRLVRKIIRRLWNFVIESFGDKLIVVPTYQYIESMSLFINHRRVQHSPYKSKLMKKFKFQKLDDFKWVREP